VSLPEFGTSGVKQFAIWTVTDNPERRAYAGIPTLGGPDRFPSEADIGYIRALFLQAGISPGAYRAIGPGPATSEPRLAKASSSPSAPLIPNREWTDKRGRKLQAELLTATLNPQGLFEGTFRRPSGEEFTCRIGMLAEQDVALVKETLTAKGLFKPGKGNP
jgi:hypothetical protein